MSEDIVDTEAQIVDERDDDDLATPLLEAVPSPPQPILHLDAWPMATETVATACSILRP